MRLLPLLVSLSLLAAPLRAECVGADMIDALAPEVKTALTAQAQAQPYGNGLLWKATRDDTTLVIFGTYHIAHAATQSHAMALDPLLQVSDIAYFEANAEDQGAVQTAVADDPSLMFLTDGPSLIDLLGEDMWPRFAREMQARGVPGFMAAKFKPMMGAMMLGFSPCEAQSGAMQQPGIDKVLASRAVELGKKNKSLEDFRTPFRLLDSFSMADQIEILELSFASADQADDMQYTIRQRYLAGEVAMIWEFSRYLSVATGDADAAADFKLFEDKLLTGRNHAWVTLLDTDTKGKTAFVAVGAAHLPGQDGLLRLLENRGFAIEPMPFVP